MSLSFSSSNFTIVYATHGLLYLKWTLCSLLSLKRNGNFQGKVVVIVGNRFEKSIVEKLFTDVSAVLKEVEKPSAWPSYNYQPLLLEGIQIFETPESNNYILFDSDVFVSSDVNPFFDKIDGRLWIDIIYSETKHKKYSEGIEKIYSDLGKENYEGYREYNAGLWSAPKNEFFYITKRYPELVRKYFDYSNREWAEFWTDQPFFTIACNETSLSPVLVQGYALPSDKDVIYRTHENKGFKHIAGWHRANKADWNYIVRSQGLLKELKSISKKNLDRSEFRKFWNASYSANSFFAHHFRMSRLNLQKNRIKLKLNEFQRYRYLKSIGFDGR